MPVVGIELDGLSIGVTRSCSHHIVIAMNIVVYFVVGLLVGVLVQSFAWWLMN